MVLTCRWLKEEPSQFFMGQTAQSLTCSIIQGWMNVRESYSPALEQGLLLLFLGLCVVVSQLG